MKNNVIRTPVVKSEKNTFSKIFLAMKWTTLLILVACLQVSAGVEAQQITYSKSNISFEKLFKVIRSQTGYEFLYNNTMLKEARMEQIDFDHTPLKEALDDVFRDQPLTYAIVGKTIVVKEKKKDKTNQQVAQKVFLKEIQGTVVDSSSGEPLSGVTIKVVGASKGTMSNANGHFSLAVENDAILRITYLGYKEKRIKVNDRDRIKIVLSSKATGLNQVVVVGYGSQSERNVTGAISKISREDFNKGVTENASDLLRGKVPGLTITQGNGDVTSQQNIQLRGASSLSGSSSPFVVIDGVPGLSINSVSPSDIESISVLKDASATAIYGSRAASGVILITTKKGNPGAPTVNYDGYVAIDKVSNLPRVLTAKEWRDYTERENMDVSEIDMGSNTNWFKEITRTGFSQKHHLSLSGGSKNNSYRGSISYLDRQGVVKANNLTRYNARLKFDQSALNDRLNFSFIGAITERDFSPVDSHNFLLAYTMIPVNPVKNEDGTWHDSREYDHGNPVRNIAYNKRNNKNSIYSANIQLDFDITNDLNAKLNLFKKRINKGSGLYNNSETERGRDDLGFAKRTSSILDTKLLEFTLNYSKILNSNNLDVLLGYSFERNDYQNFGAQNRNFPTNFFGYNNLRAGENLRPSDVWSGANMNKLISFFGRVNYIYNDKYIINASIRRDGSSKFGVNHKWGTFPAISAGWIMSDETFFEGADFLDLLKLRVGYGKTGNQAGISPYQSIELYSILGRYYDDGSWYNSYGVSQNANPNLKWESTSTFNIGFDFAMFDKRLNGTVQYYIKNTDDMLYTYQVPVPPYYISTMLANVGAMSNKGIEANFNVNIIRNKNLNWDISLNLAHNKNEITNLSNDAFQTESVKVGTVFVRGGSNYTSSILKEGEPVGSFFMWKADGLDEEGQYIIDETIDGKEGLSPGDRTIVGSAQPDLTYGLSSNIAYKNWAFNFFLRGVHGNEVLNYSRLAFGTTQWLPGSNVLKQALTSGLNESPKLNSYYIENGSFLRLDNATISYNFDLDNSSLIKSLRLHLSGQNLFVITKYTGIDPEVEMSGLAPGVAPREYIPKSRTYSIGVNIGFK